MDKFVMLFILLLEAIRTACSSSDPNQGLCKCLEGVRMWTWHCQDLTRDRRNSLLESITPVGDFFYSMDLVLGLSRKWWS